jgi:hypothetical protein
MGFDDIARNMNKGKPAAQVDPDKIIADAVKADRRMSRTADLILGTLLFAGGAGILIWSFATHFVYGGEIAAAGGFGVIVGAWRLYCGLRGKPTNMQLVE